MPNALINYNVIGARIKQARQKAKIDQHDLAASLEVDYDIKLSNKMLSRIESGARPVRDAELKAIAKLLKVTPNWLFDWEK